MRIFQRLKLSLSSGAVDIHGVHDWQSIIYTICLNVALANHCAFDECAIDITFIFLRV